MAKVITFSTRFPSYHPKAGQRTNFVEKIYNSLKIDFHNRGLVGMLNEINDKEITSLQMLAGFVFGGIDYKETEIKNHTIRSGNRWKVGDKFSPRIWSGKPYNSKQIILAPDLEVKKVWDIELKIRGDFKEFSCGETDLTGTSISLIAKNDGLEINDLFNWFNKPFKGQIICWNENINY